MTLRDIAYIVVIQEEKSITKASNKLYVTQPALSQRVRKVESELGITLFNRTSRGVQLTSEGECFL
ncbi:MAG: LysR family transcriptional regulator, partial [Clostridiales bacterium]|nr:LysR family transcriptional regulator [Clostridiales bacterium]